MIFLPIKSNCCTSWCLMLLKSHRNLLIHFEPHFPDITFTWQLSGTPQTPPMHCPDCLPSWHSYNFSPSHQLPSGFCIFCKQVFLHLLTKLEGRPHRRTLMEALKEKCSNVFPARKKKKKSPEREWIKRTQNFLRF